jgi:hypothetical protein
MKTIDISIQKLKKHPKNYRKHPPDQLEHIKNSIIQHGFYRNVVISSDFYILAGHGVTEAAIALGKQSVPCFQVPVQHTDPLALKILTGDNELGRFAEIDDRILSELLKEIKDADSLLGTGYTQEALAALVFNTRPEHEIKNIDEAAAWVGMPAFSTLPEGVTSHDDISKIVVTFYSPLARKDFADKLGISITQDTKSVLWPPQQRAVLSALKFEESNE